MGNENVVTLKNGAEEHRTQVIAIMISLEDLWVDLPMVAHELVMKCRDRDHKLFGDAKTLHLRGLMDSDGHIHETIRNVVLSAVTGDGLQMTLGNPIAPKGTAS